MPPAATLRTMTPDDVDAGLRLCRLSHWNQVARDWEQFLRLTPDGATVAIDDAGLVIGSVATMRYAAARHESEQMVERDRNARLGGDSEPPPSLTEGSAGLSQPGVPGRSGGENRGIAVRGSRIGKRESGVAEGSGPARWDSGPVPPPKHWMAWIAMVLVDPAHRGSGIGTALLQGGLALVNDADGVGLDATPLGEPLYEKLGFRTASTLLRMERPAAKETRGSTGVPAERKPDISVARVRTATAADLDAMATLDARASGLDRRAMIEWLWQGAPEFACVSTNAAAIEGFVLGRHGHDFCHIGPVIASSSETAGALVRACLRARPAHRFIIDIAEARAGWRAQLEAVGFTQQRPFARMYRGDWRPVEEPGWIHASIGPEFG